MRDARVLLKWGQWRLAKRTGVSVTTITRAEVEVDNIFTPDQAKKIEEVLAKAGVEFIPENSGGAGVRLRQGNA